MHIFFIFLPVAALVALLLLALLLAVGKLVASYARIEPARLNLACGLRLGQLDSVDREVFALSVVRDVRETPILYVCVCFARVCVCLFRLNCIKKKRIQLKYNKRIHRYSPTVPKNMAGLSLIYVAWMISLCVAVAQTGLEQGKWHLLWPC